MKPRITPLRLAVLFTAGLVLPTLLPARQDTGDDSGLPPVGSLGGPSRILTAEEAEQWKRGRERFDKPFHLSDGLGTPELNADSCRGCHQDPVLGGAGGLELNVSRFGFDNDGAGPFEDRPGGQGLSKLRPPWVLGREEYERNGTNEADVFEQRQTPTALGIGLIDGIPDAEIIANEDPDDLVTPDGIRGVARRIDVGGITEIGRFGWKSQIPHVVDFVQDAMAGECGITTPSNGRDFGLRDDADGVADPELSQEEFDDMTFFLENLAAPPRGGSSDPLVAQGELLFEQVGCAKCHIPTLEGADGPVPLYSDLLCHKVMGDDYRGMSEEGAGPGVFRTPPLWGIRDTAPYLHDGRAETIEDAIGFHAGEAESVRLAFDALSAGEREALLAFLADL